MSDFDFIYGNKKKVLSGMNMAQYVFNPLCLGYWNPNTNTPLLQDGIGKNKEFYLVEEAGSADLGSGLIEFEELSRVTYDANTGSWK